jgi:glutathione S-transferase
MSKIQLFQFPGSHFNEKARWGLDLKHVDHERVSLMPGPHMRTMKKLTGATSTPALVDDGQVVPGSTAILEHLERRFPEPPLIPESETEREQALAIVSHWDEQIGPAVRLAKFFEVMEARYAVGAFCHGQSALARGFYRVTFPLVGRLMRRMMNMNPESAAAARDVTRGAFDFVAEEPGPEGYLVGGRFTIADLTCAALLMPCVSVAEWGGPVDAPTAKNNAWLARWADQPGAEWVREIYRRHRRG